MKADLFASAFGFSRNFLMYGEGDIISPEDKTQHEPGPEKPSSGDTAPAEARPDTIGDDGIYTDLTYPYFNQSVYENHISVIHSEGTLSISTQKDTFTYHQMFTETLNKM